MTAAAPSRPLPAPDERTAPYWESLAAHVLALPRCSVCGKFSLPPEDICAFCGSLEPEYSYVPVDTAGTIRSWTVVRQSFLPGLADLVPFVLVDVELAEQGELRMIARLLDGPDAAFGIGAAVRVAFEDIADGVSIPAFELAGAS